MLTEIEARLDFEDEMPPLDFNLILDRIHAMSQDVEHVLETANYDKLLQSGLQVQSPRTLRSLNVYLVENFMSVSLIAKSISYF